MQLPPDVRVCEVGPRDGLQNEPAHVSTPDKLRLIEGLATAGIPEIEVTSFVRADLVPQLADAEEVFSAAVRAVSCHVRALVPNLKGAERALAAGATELVLVVGASETFNQKNVRRSVAESLAELERVKEAAGRRDATVLLSVATAFGCPFEGDIAEAAVLRVIEAAARLDIERVEVCDTIGVAHPKQVDALCNTLSHAFPDVRLELHFHDTRGLALANVLAAMNSGVAEFASSLGGMGGCPFAPGATGNVCTLDLVNMLHEMGVVTGVDLVSLLALGEWLEGVLGHRLPSHVLRAGVFGHASVSASSTSSVASG